MTYFLFYKGDFMNKLTAYLEEEKIRPLGRCKIKEEGLFFALSGTGFAMDIEFLSKHPLHLTFLSEIYQEKEREQYIKIFLDGKPFSKEELERGIHTISLLFPLGKHHIEVRKCNEAQESSLTLLALIGEDILLLKTKESPRKRIEFYGASTTSGFGILGNKGEHFSLKTEDETLAFPYLISKAMNMDMSVISFSGTALCLSPFPKPTMLEVYDTLDGKEKYDNSSYLPSYIILDLITNDNAKYRSLKEEKREAARKKYEKNLYTFIHRLQKNNKNVTFIFLYGTMSEIHPDLVRALENVKERYEKKHPSHFYLFPLKPNQDGADGHPSVEAHQRTSQFLISFLTRIESIA